jgi:hypothetical protein
MENITTLCTSDCSSSLNSWLSNVESACAAENITQAGVQVQAKAMVLQFTFNYDLACMKDRYDSKAPRCVSKAADLFAVRVTGASTNLRAGKGAIILDGIQITA